MPELEPQRAPDHHCLLIDQGSSRIKWIGALWTAMSGRWDLDVTSFGEGDAESLAAALDTGEIMPPEAVLLTSVATPERAAVIEGVVADQTSAELVRLTSQQETCGIVNGYRRFEKLGADRWMAIVGGAVHYGLPLVVMDLGTATTLDAVDETGCHLGGLIFPGPGSMVDALKSSTALDLSGASFAARARRPAGAPQRDTLKAIEGGIVTAQLGALGAFVKWFRTRLETALADGVKIVITGGAAGAILSADFGGSDEQVIHDPLLVFRGMLISRFGPGEPRHDNYGGHFREES